MAAIIGALRVVLGADTGAFETALGKAESKASKFGNDIAKAAAAVGLAVAGMAAAIGVGIKKTLDEADKLHKMSQSIGIPIEELSRLKHAADLSGVSLEGLGTAAGRMSKAMADIVAGGTGPAKQAFDTLGISVTDADGKLKSTTQVMTEVAGKFGNMADGSTKTALAMAIFGKSGKDLIPLLNSGATGLREMMQEADQLGIVIDAKTGKAAEAFNDNLTRLARVKDGIITQLTARMVPALATFSEWLVNTAKNSEFTRVAADALFKVFEVLARGVIFVYDNLGTLIRVMAVFIGVQIAQAVVNMGLAFVRLAAAINLAAIATAALNTIKRASLATILIVAGAIAMATGNFESFSQTLTDIGAKIRTILPADVTETISGGLEKLGLNTKALTADFQGMTTSTTEADTALRTYTPTLVNTKAQTEAARKAQKDMNEAQREGKQVYEQTRTPIEKLQEEIAKLDKLLVLNTITAETHSRRMRQLAQESANQWGEATANMAGSMEQLTNAFAKENKAMWYASKAFGIAQALINAYMAASRALSTYPPPLSYVFAAAALAQGMAYVASIRSQSPPSAHFGGNFQVPGGVGGGDKVFAPMMLEPGEMVSVTPVSEAQRSGSSVGVIRVEGVGLEDIFNGRQVRWLMERFNEQIRDGTRLEFA